MKTLDSPRQRYLAELITERRREAGMTQQAVAKALGRHQPFVATIESGQRRIDLVEFLDLSHIIGFDPHEAIDELLKVKSPLRVRKARRSTSA